MVRLEVRTRRVGRHDVRQRLRLHRLGEHAPSDLVRKRVTNLLLYVGDVVFDRDVRLLPSLLAHGVPRHRYRKLT
jgi:hypothetical protein